MTPDPNAQQERQLWAAYRLILAWPKREGGQHQTQQADQTGNNDMKANETQQAGSDDGNGYDTIA